MADNMNSKFNMTNCKIGTVISDVHGNYSQTTFVTERADYVNANPSDEEAGRRREIRVEGAENELRYDERYESGVMAKPDNPQRDKGQSKTPPPPVDRAEEYFRLKLRLKQLVQEDKDRLEEFKEALNASKSMEYTKRDMDADSTAHKVLERLQHMTKMSEDNVEPLLRLVESVAETYGPESWWIRMRALLQAYQKQKCRS